MLVYLPHSWLNLIQTVFLFHTEHNQTLFYFLEYWLQWILLFVIFPIMWSKFSPKFNYTTQWLFTAIWIFSFITQWCKIALILNSTTQWPTKQCVSAKKRSNNHNIPIIKISVTNAKNHKYDFTALKKHKYLSLHFINYYNFVVTNSRLCTFQFNYLYN